MATKTAIIQGMIGTGLAAPYLKLDWAKRHLDALDLALEDFHKSEPCRFSGQEDLENHRYVLRVELLDVPDPIPLRCGDAFYCMRACLDQLVWRLAKLKVVIPDRRVQFPVIETWNVDSEGRFKIQLADVPSEATSVIRNLQPASRTTPFESHPLWRLNAMCNLDKHRRIPANGSEVIFHLKGSPTDVRFEYFENYGLLSVPLTEKAKLDLHPQIKFQVNFGDKSAGVVLGPGDIRDIYQFIYDDVLPRFMRFFT